jgi:Putative lumazine-binding
MTDDRAAIERTVTDYFDSWFEGHPERMARVLHPKLAKRRAADAGSELLEVPYDDLVDDVASGPKTGGDRQYEIQVVAMDERMASVVVHSDPFTEYLHLARFDDGWQIVNAFYRRNRPQTDR